MPQQHMVIPHYMGTSGEQEDGDIEVLDVTKAINRQDSYCSFQDIPLLIPQEADGLEASGGHPQQNGLGKAHNVHGQTTRLSKTPFYFRKSKGEPSGSDMPMRGFVDDQDASTLKQARASGSVVHPSIKSSDREWWETQERGNLVVSADETGQVGPRAICRCQVRFNPCNTVFLCYYLHTVLAYL